VAVEERYVTIVRTSVSPPDSTLLHSATCRHTQPHTHTHTHTHTQSGCSKHGCGGGACWSVTLSLPAQHPTHSSAV
jgi:hypothetical protein